jgi:hypothetical protein
MMIMSDLKKQKQAVCLLAQKNQKRKTFQNVAMLCSKGGSPRAPSLRATQRRLRKPPHGALHHIAEP